jgi:hypothetical protein
MALEGALNSFRNIITKFTISLRNKESAANDILQKDALAS